MGATSTPITIKTNTTEKEWSMNDIFNLVQTMSENMVKNSDFNNKFDVLNKRLDINDHKFDEIKSDINKIKLQNCNIEKRINDIKDNLKSFVSSSGNMIIDSDEINNKVSNTDDNDVLTSDNNDVENGNDVEDVNQLERERKDSSNAEYTKLSLIHI